MSSLLIFLQISVGAFVSGMDAGKIYNSWPLMGSNYFPDDNSFSNLFKFSAFNEPSLVQFIHRNLAYFIFLFYLLIVSEVYKKKLFKFSKSLLIVGILLIIQIVLGILTLLFEAQIFIASMHQINSILLLSSMLFAYHRYKYK